MIQRPRRESATRTTSISANGLRMRRSDDQHFRVSQLDGVRIGVPFGALRERSSLLALGLAQAGSHRRCRIGISLKISSAAILVKIGLPVWGGHRAGRWSLSSGGALRRAASMWD